MSKQNVHKSVFPVPLNARRQKGESMHANSLSLSLFGRMPHRLNYNYIIKNTYIES